jgi:DNA-binding transcriptional MerR regulator
VSSVSIPNRPAFRAQEVCEIAGVQPYVLRGWEAEFPDLGVAKTPNGPRIYRRADVERVLRLKHLILVDGLTLAGARRQLSAEGAPAVDEAADLSALVSGLDDEARGHLRQVQEGLQWILKTLDGDREGTFELTDPPLAALPPKTRKKAGKSSTP